jgi:hypothetical protein
VTPEFSAELNAYAAVASAVATSIAAVGVWYARSQLRTSRDIAQLQFEDALTKEYRELVSSIPTEALLGEPLNEAEYQDSFDEFYRYVDLSNEQVSLRQRGRINAEVWNIWREGIEANLSLPAFNRAWSEIKTRSNSFKELRRLEAERFESDPKEWRWSSNMAVDTDVLSAGVRPPTVRRSLLR